MSGLDASLLPFPRDMESVSQLVPVVCNSAVCLRLLNELEHSRHHHSFKTSGNTTWHLPPSTMWRLTETFFTHYCKWHIEYTACLLQQLFLIFNYMALFLCQQFVLKMGNYAVQMYFLIIGCHLSFLFFFFLNLRHDSSAKTGTEAEVCLSVLARLCKNYQSLYHDICWRAEKRRKPFIFVSSMVHLL